MKKCLFAYNLGIKRDDGKIEMDTIYRDELFVQSDIDKIAEKFNCEVFVTYVGKLRFCNAKTMELNTFKSKPLSVNFKTDDADDLNIEKENVNGESK